MLFRFNIPFLFLGFLVTTSSQTAQDSDFQENRNVPTNVDMVITENDDMAENPSGYLNKTVLVKGKVQEILSSNAFLLDYDGTFGWSHILVIEPSRQGDSVTKKGTVEVIGDVQLLNRIQIEREHNIDLSSSVFEEYQNEPVVLATTIRNR